MCSSDLIRVSKNLPLIFPVHPRTKKNLENWGLLEKLDKCQNIKLEEPLSYIKFMSLIFDCGLVITDSGGIQEETSYLGIPCFTLRENTERPITVTLGSNRLCTTLDVEAQVSKVLSRPKSTTKIPLWDGCTKSRVVTSIRKFLQIADQHQIVGQSFDVG